MTSHIVRENCQNLVVKISLPLLLTNLVCCC